MPNDVIFETNDYLVRIGDREVRDEDVIISEEMFEKIRQGYMCIKCFQAFESAWPEECSMPVCRFPVRAEQSLEILRLYAGHDDEVGRDPFEEDDDPERRLRERGVWIPPRR